MQVLAHGNAGVGVLLASLVRVCLARAVIFATLDAACYARVQSRWG